MLSRNKKPFKESLIFTYIKGAVKLELKSEAGKVNYKSFLGALIFAFIFCLPNEVVESLKDLYSFFKLDKVYEAKVNLIPFYIAIGGGILCVILMGIISYNQTKLKLELAKIKSKDSSKSSK